MLLWKGVRRIINALQWRCALSVQSVRSDLMHLLLMRINVLNAANALIFALKKHWFWRNKNAYEKAPLSKMVTELCLFD